MGMVLLPRQLQRRRLSRCFVGSLWEYRRWIEYVLGVRCPCLDVSATSVWLAMHLFRRVDLMLDRHSRYRDQSRALVVGRMATRLLYFFASSTRAYLCSIHIVHQASHAMVFARSKGLRKVTLTVFPL
jgi:hypothetical protein